MARWSSTPVTNQEILAQPCLQTTPPPACCWPTTTSWSDGCCGARSPRTPRLELVGEASDGSEAVELARELAPDVVVLDLAMPDKDGLQVAGELRSHLPACAIIVFSDQDAEQAALAAGADRYIGKAAGFAAAAQAAAELAVSALSGSSSVNSQPRPGGLRTRRASSRRGARASGARPRAPSRCPGS